MKKTIGTILFASTVMIFSLNAAECLAQDSLKVKVTNIKTFTGNIMIAAGDYNNPLAMTSAMIPAGGETIECVFPTSPEPGTNIYVFHDANGNFNLDMKNGVPVEGCFAGTIETDETGTMTIELQYYAEPRTEEEDTAANEFGAETATEEE